MKRIVRILISLLGAGAFIGILALIFQSLYALGIVDVEAKLTSTALAAIYGVVGLSGLLITFISEPAIMRATVRNLKAVENKINQVPMQDVLSGIAGLMVGLILALLLSTFIGRIPIAWISVPLSLIVYIVMGYLGMTVAIKRKGELPLLRKAPAESEESTQEDEEHESRETLGRARKRNDRTTDRSIRNIPPKILDTSVIIDGRIYDIAKTGVLEGRLIVPSFVLGELRHIADSADALRRQRGRRGLDILNEMQNELNRLQVVEKEYENIEVDEMLIRLAKEMKGKVVTNDFNLNKVATVKGVEVININQLANALKPAVLPGEEMTIQVIRDGKEQGQGVGYLDDGTMIVIDGGRGHIGKTVTINVTSVLQTAAGRMVFAKLKSAS